MVLIRSPVLEPVAGAGIEAMPAAAPRLQLECVISPRLTVDWDLGWNQAEFLTFMASNRKIVK